MRTRSGSFYPKPESDKGNTSTTTGNKRRRRDIGFGSACGQDPPRKRSKPGGDHGPDLFEWLHDDLVLYILSKLAAVATAPEDLINVLLTCKRFSGLGMNPLVLLKASKKSMAIRAKNWSESAHKFLKLCSDAGNLESCYTLGMIRFYCLASRGSGAALMARAAMASHPAALYSLAIIQFNGSGGSKSDKDLRAGAALCARAALLGHVDALGELGHCLQDGYGVRRSIPDGRRFLLHANARELAAALASRQPLATVPLVGSPCPLLSDFGCVIPQSDPHPANRFLIQWFSSRGVGSDGLRPCSHVGCGRVETRRHEFRRCSVCGAVNYCSRACQALDWKLVHKAQCSPMDRWVHVAEPGPVQ
ncbi:HIT/MYND zinc finger-like protein [Dioscorea alata]|uniref:HIT/MYND zinc finger-like protein n=1 Tax=Dioscorea alata TaxID=55571 RepID=A0ACB7V9L7_DIOAL|nr:HIT/MYND zinc finger-like protein [Dioscorea alata]